MSFVIRLTRYGCVLIRSDVHRNSNGIGCSSWKEGGMQDVRRFVLHSPLYHERVKDSKPPDGDQTPMYQYYAILVGAHILLSKLSSDARVHFEV